MEEQTQAISFANSYFALVDGLASGLENHLSEDVILDWFGKTIRGRRNVIGFMEARKADSRHMFTNIVPIGGIAYQKRHSNRKKFFSYQNRTSGESPRVDIDNNDVVIFQESSEMPSMRDVVKDINQNEIVTKEITATNEDVPYDLSEGDLGDLFKLEISSSNIEEIDRRINRIKLEEEMAPTIKAIKRECGQGDGSVIVETSTVKYVEANGEIEFSRKFWKRDTWNAYFSSASNVHTWRRPCKLQIAYSTLTERAALEQPRKSKNVAMRVVQPKTRLPSLEEISEIGNRLVPNIGEFGGFLKQVDFFEDRKGFLKTLNTEMAIKDPRRQSFVPEYVRNRLVFDKPCVNADNGNDRNKKKFVFKYQIHLLVYEGNNKCRVNLLREFEKTNF